MCVSVVHVLVNFCTYVGIPVWVTAWGGPVLTLGIIFDWFFTLLIEAGSAHQTQSSPIWLAWLASWLWGPGLLSLPPKARITARLLYSPGQFVGF